MILFCSFALISSSLYHCSARVSWILGLFTIDAVLWWGDQLIGDLLLWTGVRSVDHHSSGNTSQVSGLRSPAPVQPGKIFQSICSGFESILIHLLNSRFIIRSAHQSLACLIIWINTFSLSIDWDLQNTCEAHTGS